MLRLRALRPREMRSIRHWAMELVVVVVGVLLALWAQEWVSERSDRKRLAIVERDLANELRGNLATMMINDSMAQCYLDKVEAVRAAMLASRDQWAGIEGNAVYTDYEFANREPNFMTMSLSRIRDDAWRYANDEGLVAYMDPKRREAYDEAYYFMDVFDAKIEDVRSARERLSGLIYAGDLSPEVRLAALGDLRQIAVAVAVQRRWLPETVDALRELGIPSGGNLEREVAEWLPTLAESGTVAPCVRMAAIPLEGASR